MSTHHLQFPSVGGVRGGPLKVVKATGFHLFPFRTEKLSLLAPMVLRKSGRVGRRRLFRRKPFRNTGAAFFMERLDCLAPKKGYCRGLSYRTLIDVR